MNWTKEKPTEPGWYWVGHKMPSGIDTVKPLQVVRHPQGLVIDYPTCHVLIDRCGEGWRFAGPIPEAEGEE